MPITEVLQLPISEINYWYAVYTEEYYQQNPDKRIADEIAHTEQFGMSETDCKINIQEFKNLVHRKVKK